MERMCVCVRIGVGCVSGPVVTSKRVALGCSEERTSSRVSKQTVSCHYK